MTADAMSVTRPSGQVSLGLVVEAIPSLEWAEGKSKPAAVIYIRDSVGKSLASEVVTKQLFNLTKAETALALVSTGNGVSLLPESCALIHWPGVVFLKLKETIPADLYALWYDEPLPVISAVFSSVYSATNALYSCKRVFGSFCLSPGLISSKRV